MRASEVGLLLPDDLENLGLGVGVGLARQPARLGPLGGDTGHAAVLLENVDDAPLGEIASGQRRDLPDGRADVARGSQHGSGVGHEIDLPLAVPRLCGARAFASRSSFRSSSAAVRS